MSRLVPQGRACLALIGWLVCACAGVRKEPVLKPVPDAEAVGIYHTVRPGENLYSICRAYGADLQEVAEINGIDDVGLIRTGQRLFVPDVAEPFQVPLPAREKVAMGPPLPPAEMGPPLPPAAMGPPAPLPRDSRQPRPPLMGPPPPPLEVGPPPPREVGPPLPLPEVVAAPPPSRNPQTPPASPGAPRPEAKPQAKPAEAKTVAKAEARPAEAKPGASIEKWIGQFIWPVNGTVSSHFGIRDGRRHDGLDIAAPEGTSIRAAASGTVLYSGNQQTGYGNLIILHHAQDMITVYAHNKVNLVKDGEAVKQGQEIAKVGRSGRVTKFHLHFEVRKRTKPRNPQFFLPKPS